MDRIISAIKVAAEIHQLGVGDSISSTVCPFCKGGRTEERTFGIMRTPQGLLYNCFRASCTKGRGGILENGKPVDKDFIQPSFKAREYTHPTTNLTKKQLGWLFDKYQISKETFDQWGVKWGDEELVFPIRSIIGGVIGYLTKRFQSGRLKNKTYKIADDVPWMSFFFRKELPKLYVVEDYLSAIKLWQLGYSSVAILGTHISEEGMRYLSKNCKHLVLALDRDAHHKAINMAKHYRILFKDISVQLLHTDIKDTDQEDIIALLEQ